LLHAFCRASPPVLQRLTASFAEPHRVPLNSIGVCREKSVDLRTKRKCEEPDVSSSSHFLFPTLQSAALVKPTSWSHLGTWAAIHVARAPGLTPLRGAIHALPGVIPDGSEELVVIEIIEVEHRFSPIKKCDQIDTTIVRWAPFPVPRKE
jgi:hypothetical protein